MLELVSVDGSTKWIVQSPLTSTEWIPAHKKVATSSIRMEEFDKEKQAEPCKGGVMLSAEKAAGTDVGKMHHGLQDMRDPEAPRIDLSLS